jgi:hypothetical protein
MMIVERAILYEDGKPVEYKLNDKYKFSEGMSFNIKAIELTPTGQLLFIGSQQRCICIYEHYRLFSRPATEEEIKAGQEAEQAFASSQQGTETQ